MKKRIKIILLILVLAIIFLILIAIAAIAALNYITYLRTAHSSFDNYYKFRGCQELINKTDDYGFCKLSSGEIIKIVKYNSKWYLDGDLPVSCGFFECP
jgi:hypothetical protein